MIRLYVDCKLIEEQAVSLSHAQAHYLATVMRQQQGARIELFNGVDGSWLAQLSEVTRKRAIALPLERTRPQNAVPKVRLMFAPIKKARTDFIVEKACELGVKEIALVQTEYTNTMRINIERLNAHAIEAAEQCGGDFVPPLVEMGKFKQALRRIQDNKIMFCDEAISGQMDDAVAQLRAKGDGLWTIVIGPEGGFSPAERDILYGEANTVAVSLGDRILRADTAAVSALTLWHYAFAHD